MEISNSNLVSSERFSSDLSEYTLLMNILYWCAVDEKKKHFAWTPGRVNVGIKDEMGVDSNSQCDRGLIFRGNRDDLFNV